jgi:phosphate starvation-inducible protein PhoH
MNNSRLSRKEKRKLRQDGILDENANFNPRGFDIRKDVKPITEAQKAAFDSWQEGYNIMLHGIAGTGKTFLALYFALYDVFDVKSPYKKVFIVRSTVPSRNQGFMPGTKSQKEAVYEQPYGPICTEIFGRGDSYQLLKQKNNIEFLSTSYLRGTTFDDCVIVVDEMQNMSDQELHTVMTRVGQNCKIFFAGDIKQDDLTSERFNEQSGIADFIKIISNMKQFDLIEFFAEDIVRSELVKEYIITRDKLGL